MQQTGSGQGPAYTAIWRQPGDLAPLALRDPGQLQSLLVIFPRQLLRAKSSEFKQLRHLVGLRQLKISGTSVSDRAMVHFRGLEQLERLSLDHPVLRGAGLRHLGRLCRLRYVMIWYALLQDAHLVHLARALLEFLDLWQVGITDAALQYFGEARQLRAFLPSGNPITDVGLASIANLTQLEEFSVSGTLVTDDGIVHLRNFTKLRSLGLRGSKMTDAGVEWLQKTLPECRLVR